MILATTKVCRRQLLTSSIVDYVKSANLDSFPFWFMKGDEVVKFLLDAEHVMHIIMVKDSPNAR